MASSAPRSRRFCGSCTTQARWRLARACAAAGSAPVHGRASCHGADGVCVEAAGGPLILRGSIRCARARRGQRARVQRRRRAVHRAWRGWRAANLTRPSSPPRKQ
uniref:Uncharacterized protein n=1 Tax=Arundo donax TaxID=35708 RepID=A0A0A9AIN9_ARUDO